MIIFTDGEDEREESGSDEQKMKRFSGGGGLNYNVKNPSGSCPDQD